MHVRRLRARDRGQEPRGARAACRLHLVAGGRDQRGVVEHPAVARQPVWMHGLQAPERRLGAEHPEGAQGVGVEAHREPHLREPDEVLRDVADVHVRVRHLGQREGGLGAVEDRGARVGGEFGVADDPLLLRGPVGRAAEEAVGVAHPALADRERMEHPEAVEPVVEGAVPHLELGGPVADEGAMKPVRQPAVHVQAADPHLAAQVLEAEPPVGLGCGSRRARLHDTRSRGERGGAQAASDEGAAGELRSGHRGDPFTNEGWEERSPRRGAKPDRWSGEHRSMSSIGRAPHHAGRSGARRIGDRASTAPCREERSPIGDRASTAPCLPTPYQALRLR